MLTPSQAFEPFGYPVFGPERFRSFQSVTPLLDLVVSLVVFGVLFLCSTGLQTKAGQETVGSLPKNDLSPPHHLVDSFLRYPAIPLKTPLKDRFWAGEGGDWP